jgi:hypothetical protein
VNEGGGLFFAHKGGVLDRFKVRLLGAVLVVSPFLAADALAERMSGEEAMVVMRSMGLSPELGTDAVGDPLISFHINGLHSQLNFYDCKSDRRCGAMQLETAVDLTDGITYQSANSFNTRYRYVRMYLDEDMDPYLQYDFEVLHTDAAAHLRSQLEIFGRLLDGFKEHVGY